MFSIIWVVVVVYIIYKTVYQKGNADGKSKNSGNSLPPIVNTAPRPRNGNSNQQAYSQSGNPNKQTYSGNGQGAGRQMQGGQSGGGEEVQDNSTMAYLDEKARQDAIEHEREKREEAARLHRNYGGLRVAERLFDGDAVPNGKRCSVCGYCGAENLVPMMSREKYSCYFCREPLL